MALTGQRAGPARYGDRIARMTQSALLSAAKADSLGAAYGTTEVVPSRIVSRIVSRYFSLTKSKTKIAHTPTVTGNRTNCASRSVFPLGTANVRSAIAKAVRTPSANLVLEFTVVHLILRIAHLARRSSSNLATSIILVKRAYCNFIRSRAYVEPKKKAAHRPPLLRVATN